MSRVGVADTDPASIGAAVKQGLSPQHSEVSSPAPTASGMGSWCVWRDTKAVWVSDVPGPSQTPSSKNTSEYQYLEVDVRPTMLHEPPGEGALAHTGKLTSVPGVEGHAMHWL